MWSSEWRKVCWVQEEKIPRKKRKFDTVHSRPECGFDTPSTYKHFSRCRRFMCSYFLQHPFMHLLTGKLKMFFLIIIYQLFNIIYQVISIIYQYHCQQQWRYCLFLAPPVAKSFQILSNLGKDVQTPGLWGYRVEDICLLQGYVKCKCSSVSIWQIFS